MNDQGAMTNKTPMTSDQGKIRFWPWSLVLFLPLVIGHSVFLTGCFPKPNRANIVLRRELQSKDDRMASLEAQHKTDQAQLAALSADRTVQTLPPEKLKRLFTASGIKFKNLTLGEDLDASKPGDEGFKVCIAPVDQFGDEFKSAGSFKIELFDLSATDARLGEWTIDTADAQKRWLSTPVIDGYVFTFPWQTPPGSARLLVKASFCEELTGGVFEAQANLTIVPPGKSE